MNVDKPWVVLLDEDEDDYLYLHFGFRSWADHLALSWFASVPAFLAAVTLETSMPVALLLDGVVPRGEETNWLGTLQRHPATQQAALIMLSAEFHPEQHQTYMTLGVTDHLLKPSNHHELEEVVRKVSGHVAARG